MDFKVGDKITYYDITADEFRSREIIFMADGWALVRRDGPTPEEKCPWAVTPLTNAYHTPDHPIQVGSTVRSMMGSQGHVVAIDGPAAWVRWGNDPEDMGGITSLASLLLIEPEVASASDVR